MRCCFGVERRPSDIFAENQFCKLQWTEGACDLRSSPHRAFGEQAHMMSTFCKWRGRGTQKLDSAIQQLGRVLEKHMWRVRNPKILQKSYLHDPWCLYFLVAVPSFSVGRASCNTCKIDAFFCTLSWPISALYCLEKYIFFSTTLGGDGISFPDFLSG